MEKIRFGILGSGWRAEYYIRIAKLIPDRFQVTCAYLRDKERAEKFSEKMGIRTTADLEEFLSEDQDFVVLSVKHGYAFGYLEKLLARGIPVLAETPPAETVEELERLWTLIQEKQARLQVAEQYFLQPFYAAWEKALPLLGEIENISLSALHQYHGVSIIRRFLGVGLENCTLTGKRYSFPVTVTGGRGSMEFSGKVSDFSRDRLTFEFESGKIAFFDFSGVQYHSFIRTRHLNVQGVRGEINDMEIRYLTHENIPILESLRRIDLGVYDNDGWSHHQIRLGERILYENPFPRCRLNDDEIAIASCLVGMKEYLLSGKEFYPLCGAFQDTYLSILMEKALATPRKEIQSEDQCWKK